MLRAGWRPRASPYGLVAAVVVGYAALLAFRAPWGGDFGLHAAVVERLRQDPWQPDDPMVDAPVRSPYFSPYPLLLGLIARWSDVSAITVMTVAAPFGVALLLHGLRRFVGAFTDHRWAPVLALPLVVLLWGPKAPLWSGFVNLRSLPQIMAYPSTIALGLTLLWWAALARRRGDTPDRVRLELGTGLGLGAWFGLIALVHQFTAVIALLGAASLLAARPRRTPAGPLALGAVAVAAAAAAAAAAAVIVLAWPYYSALEVARAAADLDPIHRSLYSHAWLVYGVPIALAAPALVRRVRRDRRDPLVGMVVLGLAVAVVGGLAGRWSLGRTWPLPVLAAQVALAIELTAGLGRPGRFGRPRERALAATWVLLVALAAGAGFASQISRAALAVGPVKPFTATTSWIAQRVPARDVLVSDSKWRARYLLAYGILAVAPPWPDPTLPDEARRRADLAELTDPGTPLARRRQLIEQYRVRWILITGDGWEWASDLAAEVIPGPGNDRLLRLA